MVGESKRDRGWWRERHDMVWGFDLSGEDSPVRNERRLSLWVRYQNTTLHNLGKCEPVYYKNSVTVRLPRKRAIYVSEDFNLTWNVLPHYLVKLCVKCVQLISEAITSHFLSVWCVHDRSSLSHWIKWLMTSLVARFFCICCDLETRYTFTRASSTYSAAETTTSTGWLSHRLSLTRLIAFGRSLYSVRDCGTLCLDCCMTLATTLLALVILWRYSFSQSTSAYSASGALATMRYTNLRFTYLLAAWNAGKVKKCKFRSVNGVQVRGIIILEEVDWSIVDYRMCSVTSVISWSKSDVEMYDLLLYRIVLQQQLGESGSSDVSEPADDLCLSWLVYQQKSPKTLSLY